MFECGFCPTIIADRAASLTFWDKVEIGAQLVIATGVVIGFLFSMRQIGLLKRQIIDDERHKRLSVQPVLQSFSAFVADQKVSIRVDVVNIGLGPALIKDVLLEAGVEKFSICDLGGYQKASSLFAPNSELPSRVPHALSHGKRGDLGAYPIVVGVGERYPIYEMRFSDKKDYYQGLHAMDESAIVVVYESIYGDRAELRIPTEVTG